MTTLLSVSKNLCPLKRNNGKKLKYKNTDITLKTSNTDHPDFYPDSVRKEQKH